MTQQTFNNNYAALLNAFPNSVDRITPQTRDVYWLALKEIPDDIFTQGVMKCIQTCKFFPTAHEIGVACFGETKEHYVQKCDPWRFQQNYEEYVPAVAWSKNMQKRLEEKSLEAPLVPELPLPKKSVDWRLEKMEARLKDLKDERDTWKIRAEKAEREVSELKEQIKRPTIEERKAELRRQAEEFRRIHGERTAEKMGE